ncbi:MAG TPA: peptidylprolyl isomerase [Acidobacteriota bacterium]|nr:peptidylprolyl isomerase [Acidobacteriota bacterium]
MAIQNGSKVSVHYTGKLSDGSTFDSSLTRGEPLQFTIGEKQVIKGFEDALVGMDKGDKKTVNIPAAEAYGMPDDRLMQDVPRDHLPKDQEPQVGMLLGIRAPDGMEFPARIAKVTETTVTLDLNHPLAGKDLTFELEVVEYS